MVSSYASQLYVTSIGILVLPLYIRYMGVEAYGLVGFFTMLQAWFSLLDMGLTPTIGRETARFYGGSISPLSYRQLFRALSFIFLVIAFSGSSILWLSADFIASNWLDINSLDFNEVIASLQLMAIIVGLRWMGGLYRGVITGAERLVWLSVFNIFVSTLRFIGVFLSMWRWGFSPHVFFVHQLVVALIEIVGLFKISAKLIPARNVLLEPIGWSVRPIHSVLRFSLTIAFTSSIWIFATQTDKLILSGILPLSEYGYFSLAVLVASGILAVTMPISSAIMPRLARLHAEGNSEELKRVYRNATQLVCLIGGSVSIVMTLYAETLLYLWTGDAKLAAKAAPILQLYSAGNGLLSVAAFSYYLQYALGRLRYHFIGSVVMSIVLLPSIFIAATYFGVLGAGYVWLTVNCLFLFLWVGYVHNKLQPGLHWQWMVNDVLAVLLPVLVVVSFYSFLNVPIDSRFSAFLQLVGVSSLAVVAGALSSSYMRYKIVMFFK